MKVAPLTEQFIPKSITALRDYSVAKFIADLIAGLTVGLVALPLAMAFAISSGVKPEAGLYCAVIAGFLISALGGSMCQIGGPTGAFVVVVAGIVQKHGMDGLFMCTLLAGLMLIGLGLSGLGTAVKFIPRPVVVGFTNGIAVLIASTQIKDFFGLQIDKVPSEFPARIQVLATHFNTISLASTAVAVGTLLTIIVVGKLTKRVPGTIVALFTWSIGAFLLHLAIPTIGTKFGSIPQGLPTLHIPHFRADLILPLLSPALTVTMLGAIESLLSAVVSDRMSGDKHNPNVELFAQGVANFFSPLFGGLPATGAIARTATNVRSGAKTPVAGMIHAVVLLVILLVAAPVAEHIPLAVLAGILIMVSYNMGEWHEIPHILKQTKADRAVWFITFFLTVFADLTVAVEAGMILAALLYIRQVTATTTVAPITEDYIAKGHDHSLQTNDLPEGVSGFRIHGPFLFGSTDKLDIIHENMDELGTVVMLRLRNMNAIDATGLGALVDLAKALHKTGRHLVLCGARTQPLALMQRSEFHKVVGDDNIQPSLKDAITRAQTLLDDAEEARRDLT